MESRYLIQFGKNYSETPASPAESAIDLAEQQLVRRGSLCCGEGMGGQRR